MLLLLFGNCSCGGGCSSQDGIVDLEGAPFSLQEAETILWITNPGDTEESAVLLVTTAELSCGALAENDFYNWDETVMEGSGLIFVLDQNLYGDTGEGGDTIGWTGLWMGESMGEGGYRTLESHAFHQGQAFTLDAGYVGGSTWLDIESSDSDDLSGSFATTWWSGSFTAARCGVWAESNDTDWGSDWWDTF